MPRKCRYAAVVSLLVMCAESYPFAGLRMRTGLDTSASGSIEVQPQTNTEYVWPVDLNLNQTCLNVGLSDAHMISIMRRLPLPNKYDVETDHQVFLPFFSSCDFLNEQCPHKIVVVWQHGLGRQARAPPVAVCPRACFVDVSASPFPNVEFSGNRTRGQLESARPGTLL